MRIDQMNNDQAADAMVRISGAVSSICEDKEMLSLMDELQNMGDMPVFEAIPKLLPKFTAKALKEHKGDLYEIIGALTSKGVSQVGNMNFMETVNVIRENFDTLRDFFTSTAPSQMKSVQESA